MNFPCILELVDGNLTLRYRNHRKRNQPSSPSHRTPVFVHSILSVTAISYEAKSQWFQLSFVDSARVYFRCVTPYEALEWVLLLKRELWNQILVCQTLFVVLKREGHADRGEALFEQMLRLVKVIFQNRDHFQVAKIHKLYAEWLSTQPDREQDSLNEFARCKTMQAKCELNS